MVVVNDNLASRFSGAQGMKPIVIGSAAGLAGSVAAARLVASQLYGVSGGDPVTMVSVTLVLLVVALTACWVPARRAARLDPMVALRTSDPC